MKVEYRRMAVGYLIGAVAAAVAFAAILALWLTLEAFRGDMYVWISPNRSGPLAEIPFWAQVFLALLAYLAAFQLSALPSFLTVLIVARRLKRHRAAIYALASVMGALVYAPWWIAAFLAQSAHQARVEAAFAAAALLLLPAAVFGYGYWFYVRRHPPISEGERIVDIAKVF